MNEEKSLSERWIHLIKNNRIFSIIVVAGFIFGILSNIAGGIDLIVKHMPDSIEEKIDKATKSIQIIYYRIFQIAIPGSNEDFIANVGDRVFFSENSAFLSAEAIEIIQKQAKWLNEYSDYTFTIEGQAPNVKLKGLKNTGKIMLNLGEDRAESVKSLLVNLGISAERINIVSYGKEAPQENGYSGVIKPSVVIILNYKNNINNE